MQTTSSQPRAIYYVVALQIWEYFSFYGMRALLILYLTNQLKYDDNHAYALFSAYCSLVYVTPILGGYLADKLLGNRMAVMLGALLGGAKLRDACVKAGEFVRDTIAYTAQQGTDPNFGVQFEKLLPQLWNK